MRDFSGEKTLQQVWAQIQQLPVKLMALVHAAVDSITAHTNNLNNVRGIALTLIGGGIVLDLILGLKIGIISQILSLIEQIFKILQTAVTGGGWAFVILTAILVIGGIEFLKVKK